MGHAGTRPRRSKSRTHRWATFGAALACGVLATLTLAWHDVLPGGWRLRGYVRPHWEREAAERAAHRAARLAEFAREPVQRDAVVFLGSSTIERFPLATAFPGVTCVDRGIGYESLAELLTRVATSLPPEPKAVVVYTGSVDVRWLARPAEEVARNAEALLDLLAEHVPRARVAWIGVLPDRTQEPRAAARVTALNTMLAELLARRGDTFVPTHRAPLVDVEGRLAHDHSADELHLSERGYAVLAAWLREVFTPLGGG
jgi:lysophospholipase L1-like esterase